MSFPNVCTAVDPAREIAVAGMEAAGGERPRSRIYNADKTYMASVAAEFFDPALAASVSKPLGTVQARLRLSLVCENGTWQIDYRLSVNYVRPFSTRDICAVFSILLGTCILLILTVSLYRKQQVAGSRYDERQEVEQGRSFRYAFYAAMVTVGVSLIIDSMGIFADGMSSVFYAASIFIGLMVYVIYGYWHDCYIALNEKKGFTITLLLIIGVINLVIGLSSLNRDGWLNETGHMNTADLNFLCGATAILLVVAGLIRFVTEKLSAKDDGGDDE